MIQQSINQLITTAGVAARFSPGYEKRKEAAELLGKATSAKPGLEAIEKGLKEKGKKLTETELSDIERRTADLNKNIYAAKIRAKEGDPLSPYLKDVSDLPKQEEHSRLLKSIEKSIEKKRKQTWQQKAEKKLETTNKVNQFRESLILGADERPLLVKEK